MGIGLEIAFSFVVSIPVLGALYLDRYFHNKVGTVFSLLLFPCVITVLDYHTRVAFLRGIENGFSVIRQSIAGSSISADYLGNTLTYQNFFRTTSRVMISDVPQQGAGTLYGYTGEVFLWLAFALLPFMLILGFARAKKQG